MKNLNVIKKFLGIEVKSFLNYVKNVNLIQKEIKNLVMNNADLYELQLKMELVVTNLYFFLNYILFMYKNYKPFKRLVGMPDIYCARH